MTISFVSLESYKQPLTEVFPLAALITESCVYLNDNNDYVISRIHLRAVLDCEAIAELIITESSAYTGDDDSEDAVTDIQIITDKACNTTDFEILTALCCDAQTQALIEQERRKWLERFSAVKIS